MNCVPCLTTTIYGDVFGLVVGILTQHVHALQAGVVSMWDARYACIALDIQDAGSATVVAFTTFALLLQVIATLAAVAGTAMVLTGVGGPGAVILGGGLALSSTAVAMQVLQDRGESGSRHGRATFAVLLLQVRTLSAKHRAQRWHEDVKECETHQSMHRA